jgi:DNA segregation ATPase FtsK/SpoIIIE, S-DNA-T family
MDILTTFEILGSLSATALGYLGLQSRGFGAKYWQIKDPELKISHRDAAYVRRTWPKLARNLKLALRDDVPTVIGSMVAKNGKPEPRIRVPKLQRVTTDHYGIVAEFRTLPGIGLEEFEGKTKYFADAWDMTRVAVHQVKPRVVHVRAVREDPLQEVRVLNRPAKVPSDLTSIPIGIDDYAQMVRLGLKSETGIGVYGAPRRGKTSLVLGLMTALADREEVQFVLADGKVSTGFEGDYYDLGHRCLAVIGDSLEDYNALIKEVAKVRELRQRTIRQELGTPNFWDRGPSRAWPLLFVVIDEGHTYYEQITPAGNNADIKTKNALAAENAYVTADLIKKCGSVGIFFVIATQKPTSDAIPTAIRANLTYRLCLGVREESVAVAALGEDIKKYPDMMPTQFMRNEFRGCAVMVHEDRPGFTRFRNPYTGPQLATQTAYDTKHLVMTRNARLGLTVGRTHLQQLPNDAAALLPPVKEIEN